MSVILSEAKDLPWDLLRNCHPERNEGLAVGSAVNIVILSEAKNLLWDLL
jgi:hypothetical protein